MTFCRAHRIRLEPTTEQHQLLACVTGCARFAYNWALDMNKYLYDKAKAGLCQKPTFNTLNHMFIEYKRTTAPDWLHIIPGCASNHAIRHSFSALKNFFEGRTCFPSFHKKGRNDSFYISNKDGRLKHRDNHWYFHCPNVGDMLLSETPRYKGKIMSYTISYKGNHWYVSIQYQLEEDPRPACENLDSPVGIDVGVRTAITCSDGNTYQLADVEKLRRKLKYQQRYLSRSQKKSNNHKKYLEKVRSTTERIQNKINDSIHKATTAIAKKHGVVVVEDLNVAGMKAKKHAKSRASRRNLQNACMSEILRQLAYKAQQCFRIDRFFPSSQLCSVCGHRKPMPVDIRQYVCSSCGSIMDRDLNAAINILQEYFSGRVTPVVSCG